jgi:putative acyl-CoA dehydrogenase
MCDAFLVLAQAPGGLTCFLLPRFTPDGRRNPFLLQRLKDKLGNRSNASSEVEFRATWARRVGEEGRGVPTILEMVNHTRLDCVIGAAAGLRFGTAWALHHARHRSAFGKLLWDQPLMRNVLADLAIESEAATVAMMRLARAYDEAALGGGPAADFRRLATAVLKYWTCKRAPVHAAEALECLGGNGYVEEWPLARLYREAPLNSIWEGSGNVQCLDVLRAVQKTPGAKAALLAEVAAAKGADRRLDAFAADLEQDLGRLGSPGSAEIEGQARRLVERMALCLQGSLLVRHSPPAVADAFCTSRLGGDGGRAFGTLPAGTGFAAILARHAPES